MVPPTLAHLALCNVRLLQPIGLMMMAKNKWPFITVYLQQLFIGEYLQNASGKTFQTMHYIAA